MSPFGTTKTYTFTGDGYFYGSAGASHYSVNGTDKGWEGYCSIRAEILDASGNSKIVIADIGGTETVTGTKIFVEVKKGWHIEIISYTVGGNRGNASVGGTAIYMAE